LNPNPKVRKKDPKGHGMGCRINQEFDVMVKIDKLAQKFENLFFGMTSLKNG
jgi:hypothetical protein